MNKKGEKSEAGSEDEISTEKAKEEVEDRK